MAVMVESVKAAQRFASAHAWDGYLAGPFGDSANATTDAGIREYASNVATTIKHPFSTAALNKAPGKGVVDGQLLLKKAKGVRIVDASVFVSLFRFLFYTGTDRSLIVLAFHPCRTSSGNDLHRC